MCNIIEEDDTERELSCLLLLQCFQYKLDLATQKTLVKWMISSVSIRFLPPVFLSPELRCHAAWNFFRF